MIVQRLDMTVPALYRDYLHTLAGLGFTDPILFGGALRDVYMSNTVNDLDSSVGVDDLANDMRIFHRANIKRHFNFNGLQLRLDEAFVQQKLASSPEFDVRDVMTLFGNDRKGEHVMGCKGLFNGMLFHVTIQTRLEDRLSLTQRCLDVDAPINGIAMNVKGEVYAHPDFKRAAAARDYTTSATKQTPEKARRRFDHLAAKIPGLQFHYQTA